MTEDVPGGARLRGLRHQEFRLLVTIAAWYNGFTFELADGPRNIATHHEPDLEALCEATPYTYDPDAFERLQTQGYLESRHICRLQIDWVPTRDGLQAINEYLGKGKNGTQPDWRREESDDILVGRTDESLLHRKGVATVAPSVENSPGLHGGESPITRYPVRDEGHYQDIYLRTPAELDHWGVEVVTAADAITDLIDKWQDFTGVTGNTLWIFDGRETACDLFNELHRREIFILDGGLCTTPQNWTTAAINQKLWRSENRDASGGASPAMQTITAVFEGDENKIADVVREYDEY